MNNLFYLIPLKKELDKRVIEIKENPSIGIPFEEVKKKIILSQLLIINR